MRIGIGYDIHKLVKGEKLILGGVEIPFELGLLAHSDGDCLIHCIIDAIFGALALRDIGYHFPDNDEKYKNADSIELLKETCKILKSQNYKIVNIDTNIICQKPKLSSYIDLMRENIAQACDISVNQISIKAKTNEHLDSVGQSEGISSNAVVLVEEVN